MLLGNMKAIYKFNFPRVSPVSLEMITISILVMACSVSWVCIVYYKRVQISSFRLRSTVSRIIHSDNLNGKVRGAIYQEVGS